MVFKIKTPKEKKKIEKIAVFRSIADYEDLDDIAYLRYGNKFSELSKKEKIEIAKKFQNQKVYH
jgi:hypothetical protein